MKVKHLIKLLREVDPEMEVLIPMNESFDGFFRSPCAGETGVSEIADIPLEHDEHGGLVIPDEEDEAMFPKKEVFMILPHGFSEEPAEDHVHPEMN
jgi:hypothetical protein